MHIPSNRWCGGSGRAGVQTTEQEKAKCPTCGYTFRKVTGVVPQHRPKFNEKKVSA